MFTYNKNELLYWNYYIALEADLNTVSRYIEFCQDNEKAYSIELVKILIAAASEVDVLCKLLCSEKSQDCSCIREYRECIIQHYPEIPNENIFLKRYSMNSKPWLKWGDRSNTNPDWWKSYNNVKHQRNEYYKDGNLKNTINALGALQILIIYYLKEKNNITFIDATSHLEPVAQLITLNDEYYQSTRITG